MGLSRPRTFKFGPLNPVMHSTNRQSDQTINDALYIYYTTFVHYKCSVQLLDRFHMLLIVGLDKRQVHFYNKTIIPLNFDQEIFKLWCDRLADAQTDRIDKIFIIIHIDLLRF